MTFKSSCKIEPLNGDDLMETLGQRLKKLRVEARLTQQQLSKKLDLYLTQYSRYETGNGNPSVNILSKIAAFFEVPIDYLVHGEDKFTGAKLAISDGELLELFRKVNKLKKPLRDQVKWAIDGLLCKLPHEEVGVSSAKVISSHKVVKSTS